MCAPGLQLNARERYELRAYEPIAVETFGGERIDVPVTHHDERFDGVSMNMRRTERIVTQISPIKEAQALSCKSSIGLMRQSQSFGVLSSANGIWERRDPTAIMLPEGYRIAAMLMDNQAFLLTVGPQFKRAVQQKYGYSPTLAFYEHVFTAHGFNPRAPLLIRSSVKPIETVAWEVKYA